TGNKFMMVNAGSLAGGEYDDATSNGLLNIVGYIKPTKTEAQANPAKLAVDRVVAKVEVKSGTNVTDKQGGTVEFKKWCLNTTNKKTNPYTNLVKYEGGTGNYRIDHNYSNNSNTGNFISDNFNVLKAMPADAKSVTTTATANYCFENTMQADQQMNAYTTSVVVEATYTPKGATKGDSYFVFRQKHYKSIAELDAALTANFVTQANLDKLATDYGYTNWSNLKEQNNGTLTNLENKNLVEGKAQNPATDILFYKKGVNYYMQMIKHDDAVGQNKLGRWGVVRNNWYVLTLNSVNGFGSPIFPDPDPETPNDKEGWLGVQITVNNWSMWQQGVDFE
ncbi:MAG: Mfa1 family fimbria major subunit, partial [Bacteroidales bacterium]